MFNAGKGKLWFFFTTQLRAQCAGLTTGATAAVPGHGQAAGQVPGHDIPLPPDVSTRVANQPNFYGSLIKETLTWSKLIDQGQGQDRVQQRLGRLPEGQAPVVGHVHRDHERQQQETQTVNGSSKC